MTGKTIAARSRDLVKTYGSQDAEVFALAGVSLDILEGEFTAVMGPSGSGKSTFMHCMAALDVPTAGQVLIGDTDVARLDDKSLTELRRDRIGFVFQSFNLVPTLTAEENIMLPLAIAKRQHDPQWFEKVISAVGLQTRLGHRPNQLSGGQQQRVACARALMSRPEIIFADEPTGNLDSTSGAEVLGFLRQSVDDFGQTIVMVTHDPVAASYTDRVVFLADGKVVDELRNPTAEAVLARMSDLQHRGGAAASSPTQVESSTAPRVRRVADPHSASSTPVGVTPVPATPGPVTPGPVAAERVAAEPVAPEPAIDELDPFIADPSLVETTLGGRRRLIAAAVEDTDIDLPPIAAEPSTPESAPANAPDEFVWLSEHSATEPSTADDALLAESVEFEPSVIDDAASGAGSDTSARQPDAAPEPTLVFPDVLRGPVADESIESGVSDSGIDEEQLVGPSPEPVVVRPADLDRAEAVNVSTLDRIPAVKDSLDDADLSESAEPSHSTDTDDEVAAEKPSDDDGPFSSSFESKYAAYDLVEQFFGSANSQAD